MGDKKESDSERWLSVWETETMNAWEEESEEEQTPSGQDELFVTFQNAASTIADLYRDGSSGLPTWIPFQNAASSVTRMYKGSQDAIRKNYDCGTQYGYRKRTKELLAWLKKRRCNIRRDELIGFLCGKPIVRHQRHSSSLHRGSASPGSRSSSGRLVHSSGRLNRCEDGVNDSPHEADLQTFRDALALQGLNGAMSNISMERIGEEGSAQRGDDFHCIILDEMSRRLGTTRKRTSGSASEQRVDSPTRKRMRLWTDNDDDGPIY